MTKKTWISAVIAVIVLIVVFVYSNNNKVPTTQIRIGIVTDLSGPAAYWGESTRAGAEIALKELKSEGYNVSFVYEDYGLDATKAATAAQKLTSVDNVNGMYAEFNPAAIAVASVVKSKNLPFIYDAAVTSPLKESGTFLKTYLDYQAGCRSIAEKFKNDGIEKLGFLKVNLEFGELCEAGIKEVYGTAMDTEGYNLGDTDFRTQLLKIKNSGAGAVVNVGFEGDTFNTLKVIKDLEYGLKYGTVDDTITDKVKTSFGNELKGGWSFGFQDVDSGFVMKVDDFTLPKKVASYYGAALAYTHLFQMVKAIAECDGSSECTVGKISNSKADKIIGFSGYQNRIANLKMQIKQY